jgi:cyclopropane fatty-acyl-phospholipid synthase-like methyltransferase
MTMSWDGAYTASAPAPWDIGRPQPAFVRLAEQGLLSGQLLDSGCGTGEHALLAAGHGAAVLGVDLSPRAIELARAKAAERGLTARFEVADATGLGGTDLRFDTVIDSGVFHVFDDQDRARYVASLAAVLRDGGHCHLLCFSERQPGTCGPRRVSQDDLRAAFAPGWEFDSLGEATFDLNQPGIGIPVAQAWLADIRRVRPGG